MCNRMIRVTYGIHWFYVQYCAVLRVSVLCFPFSPSSCLSLSLSLILIPTVVEEFGSSGYNSLTFLWGDVIFQDCKLEAEGGEEERLLFSTSPLAPYYASQTRGF
jgi:hypothetical protein